MSDKNITKFRFSKRILKIAALPAALIIGGLITFGCSNAPANSTAANVTKNTAATAANKTAVVNSAAPAANLSTGKVPVSLSDAGEYGENTYDMAKANDWTKAAEKLRELKQSQSQLASQNIKSPQLDQAIAALEKDVAAKDRLATLRDANQVTFVVADLTAKYNPPIPVEITKLDYYGRELETEAMAKDEAKLKSTAQALRDTWNRVKPKVEAKGGTKQAQNFETLIAKTDAANNATDYAKIAAPILDEVDSLEKVFEKNP